MFNHMWFVLFFLAGGLGVVGNVLLKFGVNHVGKFDFALSTLLPTLLRLGTNPAIFLGVLFYAASSVFYLKVISAGDVTRIYPLSVAYMFILLLILGATFLKEPMTFSKIGGIAIILIGITIASR